MTSARATLEVARARWRESLGPYGLWRTGSGFGPDSARAADRLGFGSMWLGGSPAADLEAVERLLAATERIVVATGIVNIWTAAAAEVAASYHRLEARFPGRFILGVGPGHPERFEQAARPYGPLVEYLDVLEAEGVPASRLVLAALGDRVLALAGERTLGAHPYFVPPAHTAHARAVLGPSPLLIPEVRVALVADPEAARARLRRGMTAYFALRNYRSNLLRLGYAEEELDPGLDSAIDRLALWGEPPAVRAGIDAHLAAGADHALVQLVVGDDGLVGDLERLAAALELS